MCFLQENGLPSTILRKDDEMVIPGDCRPYGISLFDKNLMVCAGDGKLFTGDGEF